MADDSTINKNIDAMFSPSTQKTTEAQNADAGKVKKSSNSQVSQQEFLMLLTKQLQNQDPLDPMKNEEFAVQLATFSQLEQLVQINDKLGKPDNTSAGQLASYLGRKVSFDTTTVPLTGGQGPDLSVLIPEGTQAARIELLDTAGKVVASQTLDTPESGQLDIGLKGLQLKDGDYSYRIKGVSRSGEFTDLSASVTGTVEGFVMEPEAALIVGGSKLSLDKVKEVRS
jgi:flagellar basal-body rod modification protein FlgD